MELRHVIDEFQRIALAHPEIKFLFFNNGSDLFDLPITRLRKRITSVFGTKWDGYLLPVEEKTSLVQLNGFILKPEFSKKTRGYQFFFVNNRFIKSPFLNHAVSIAFEGLLKLGYYPGYFLYITIDPKTIDINIHPKKTEVKFEEEQNIYAILRSAVKHSLGVFQVLPTLDFDKNSFFDIPYSFKQKNPLSPSIEVDASFNPFKSGDLKKQKDDELEGVFSGIHLKTPVDFQNTKTLIDVYESTRVFQLFKKYIICPLKTSMLIIDQSRAHQRILYERFLSSITSKKCSSQQLLFPLKIELSLKQTEEYNLIKDILVSFGFQMRLKKQMILEIIGSPEYCPHSKIEGVIEILLSGESTSFSREHFSQADQIAKTLSKSLAIKTGKKLEAEEQQSLLDDFFGCKETRVSPFNKPIFINLGKTEIEQKLS